MSFISSHIGEFAALLTAVFWTVSAIAFENASNRLGSLTVNILRLIVGFVFLTILNVIRRNLILPTDATGANWIWLGLSGMAGFVFGDLFLFKAYTVIGSRFSMLFMTLAPPLSAFFGWIIIGERLELLNLAGMFITLCGISIAIFARNENGNKLTLKLAPTGVLYAIGGALGQALGIVLSKFGMKDYDPFAATQIRIIAGIAGFAFLVTIMGRWKRVGQAIHDDQALKPLTLGAFFGPFLGVSFSLLSVKFTKTGIASTIMALVPVFILVPAIFIYRQKVTLPEIIGSVISVIGVGLFFI